MIRAECIIISDIHLGSETTHPRELNRFLSAISCRYLIMNGDMFDDLRFARLKSGHWKVLTRLRKLSGRTKVVWVRGNHDTLSADTLSHLLGMEVRDHYEWKWGKRKFYAVHGDRWDIFTYKHPRLTRMFIRLHQFLLRHFPKTSERMARNLKRKNRYLSRNSRAVEYSAIRYGDKRNFDAVFCGHTHMASLKKEKGVVYANSGSWQEENPHFVTVGNGKITLMKYSDGRALTVASERIG